MAKMKCRLIISLVTGFSALMTPALSIAGGKWQEKIQQKLGGQKSNIQLQYDAAQQYEPYYLQEGQVTYPASPPALKEGDRLRRADKKGELSAALELQSRADAPISTYAIYKADYRAELEDDVVTINGKVLFEVFRKGWVRIPVVRSDVGLIDVSINKGASFVTAQGGKYYLIIDKPGRYSLDMEFLIKASRERENGPGSFNFEVMPAPVSQFEFSMPESEVEIFVEPAIKVELKREPKKTTAWAIMPNTSALTVRWSKALPRETIAPVKLEPKAYADVETYSSVGDGFIRCQANVNYSILQSEISSLRIALPEDTSVLEVQGRDLRDWKVSVKDGMQYLDAYLNFGIKGSYSLSVSYEKKIGEGSQVAQIPWIKTQGVERERGFLGVAAATNVELAVNKIEQANPIDVKELPQSIWRNSPNPILLAFKYLNAPFNISLDVTRHEELPVLVAAIDSVDYTTLYTDEGKSLTKAVYQVRNNVKQFIHLVLPQNASLWSVFVAGNPVKPAKDKEGNILIPLEKSQATGQGITQFPVEIVYLDKNSRMRLAGNVKLNLPRVDIPISSLSWSVYFPSDYLYFNFGGDVKELEKDARILPFMRSSFPVQRGVGGLAESRLGEQYDAQQVMDFSKDIQSAKMKGLLPIKIDIPQAGKLYRFSKLLVTEKEGPWLSASFVVVFKQIRKALKFSVSAGILFLAALFITKIIRNKIKPSKP